MEETLLSFLGVYEAATFYWAQQCLGGFIDTRGTYRIVIDNVLVWFGMSEPFASAVISLLKTGRIRFLPADHIWLPGAQPLDDFLVVRKLPPSDPPPTEPCWFPALLALAQNGGDA